MPEVNSSFTEKTDEFSKKTVTEMILTRLVIETKTDHAHSRRVSAAVSMVENPILWKPIYSLSLHLYPWLVVLVFCPA